MHIGNFVEVKNVTLALGPKPTTSPTSATAASAPKANIGAGTIFCNYDGFNKHTNGDWRRRLYRFEYVACSTCQDRRRGVYWLRQRHYEGRQSGSTGARARSQEERPGWAEKFRTLMTRRKGKS